MSSIITGNRIKLMRNINNDFDKIQQIMKAFNTKVFSEDGNIQKPEKRYQSPDLEINALTTPTILLLIYF